MSFRPYVQLLLTLAALHLRVAACPHITISEIMYHPAGPGELLEFLEIHAPEPPRIDCSGWRIEGEVTFEFPPGTVLLPGSYVVVARAPAILQQAYSLAKRPFQFHGRLGNKGGRVRLMDAAGPVACEVAYKDDAPWPVAADGTGHSLSLLDPLLDPADPASWRVSLKVGGTPGAPNGFGPGPGRSSVPPPAALAINEVRAGEGAYIEIFNRTADSVDLKGYFLTDSLAELKRYVFPGGVTVGGFGFLALKREAFGPAFSLPGPAVRLALTEPGGENVVDAVRLTGLEGGAAQGRFPDGAPSIHTLAASSPGAANTISPVPELIFSEIMYNPISGDDEDEYVEIHNRSKEAVELGGFKVCRGISFTFPEGARIGAGGYAVVAKSPSRIAARYGLGASIAFGPYSGVLSNEGEMLRLEDAAGRLVDAVGYGDRDPWPAWADGLGSSLELIDVGAENDLAAAWGASDDRRRARWQIFKYAGLHREFLRSKAKGFQFLLLDTGECLIDSVQIASSSERLVTEEFGRSGLGWRACGTHEGSGVATEFPDGGRRCYRIVADGRGNPRDNYVSVTVDQELEAEKRYYLGFRAKWQRGCAHLLTRTIGQGVALVHTLKPPRKLGTPGAPNSIARSGAAPIVGVPAQDPVAPKANEPVRVRVRIDESAGTESRTQARILYRRDGETDWGSAPISRSAEPSARGTGFWSGTVPPMGKGIVEYYIEAADGSDGVGRYPADAPERTACYLVGLTCHERLPTYHLLVTRRNWDRLKRRAGFSNQMTDATFVYGTSHIFYNVTFRPRGSPYTRRIDNNYNWKIRFGSRLLDGRRTYILDGQKQDDSLQQERLVHWLLSQLGAPSLRQRYVSFNLYGHESGVFEDVERIDGEFVDRWYPGAAPGNLHKIDDYFEFSSGGGREEQRIEARFVYKGKDPELYRWNFPARSTGAVQDFKPLVELVALMDPKTTGSAFASVVEKYLDVDQWLRTFSVRTAVNDWDTYGRNRGKNAYLYRTGGEEGLWRLLAWDSDLSFRRPRDAIFSEKFAAMERLLAVDKYRRQFLSYLACLASGPLSPDRIRPILADTGAACGKDARHIVNFAAERCAFILGQIPPGPSFTVRGARRVTGREEPDRLRATGLAPTMVSRFSLNGTPGTCRIEGDGRWVAEFPLGPEGGAFTLSAETACGELVAREEIKAPARRGAPSLAVPEPPEPVDAVPSPPAPPQPTVTLALGDREGKTAPREPEVASVGEPPRSEAPAVEEGSELYLEQMRAWDRQERRESDSETTAARELASRRVESSPPSAGRSSVARRTEAPQAKAHEPRRPPLPGGSLAEEPSSSSTLLLAAAAILLGLGFIAAIMLLAFREWRKVARGGPAIGKAAREAVIPGAGAREAVRPGKAARGAVRPGNGAREAVGSGSTARAFAADLEKLGSSDFEIASSAFGRLVAAGRKALPILLESKERAGATPFGKIKRGSAGLHTIPAGAGLPPIPLAAVLDLLIKLARRS